MFRYKWLVLLLTILFAATVSAEIYMFKDQHGNTVFTDDITRVPRNQQPGVQKYEAYQTEPEKSVSDVEKEKSDGLPKDEFPAETQAAGSEEEDIIKRFDRTKLELDREYQELDKEKKRLDRLKTNLKGKDAVAEYNKSVSTLNDKIDAYERKKEAFNAEVNQYNAKIKADIKKILESRQPKK